MDVKELRAAVRHEGGLSRRLLLVSAACLAALPLLAERSEGAAPRPRFVDDPFTLGVASGDPEPTGVVLWTRLAPQPLYPAGGIGPDPVDVAWEVADDEGFTRIVKSGKTRAIALLAHSVHVEVDGLQPDRWYWYRFRAGDALSPVGRTRTLPEPGASPERLRFAFASCQHWESGLFTAYGQMARDDLDLVFHLGDYIYEGAPANNGVRRHAGPKLMTLDDYRVRHSQYRGDPLLQAVHARFPWFLTWDDHEVENDYADDISQTLGYDPGLFLIQRAAAYQAYYEMMPLRRRSLPHGPDMQIYRKASFGRLAELLILDTRQYRTDQPNGDRSSPINDAALSKKATLMGAEQRRWLEKSLRQSSGAWNVLAQQVMMGMADVSSSAEKLYSMDQWPGYAKERMDVIAFLKRYRIANPVVLAGDIHTNWVNDLHVDDRKPETPIVATEFVGTSISSGGNGVDRPARLDALLSRNPFVRFHNQQRGYVRCTVTKEAWRSDYLTVDQVREPGGKVSERASFVVESGRPGAKPA